MNLILTFLIRYSDIRREPAFFYLMECLFGSITYGKLQRREFDRLPRPLYTKQTLNEGLTERLNSIVAAPDNTLGDSHAGIVPYL